jgi:hypothetical protein
LRAVVVSGEGVRSDQIADHNRLGCPAASVLAHGYTPTALVVPTYY